MTPDDPSPGEATPAARPPGVAVAVLTWRGYELTRSCLKTLWMSAAWPFPILVVDNASGTGEGDRLGEEFGPSVSVLTTERNEGVSGGYNAALQWAASIGASHVLLLNNDTLLDDPDLVGRLMGATGDDVAAVGPVVRGPDASVQSAGGRLRVRTGRASPLAEIPAGSGGGPYNVDWLDGSALLVSLAAYRAIGGLEPAYFLYWEEVDWCVRARRAGWRLLVEPRASITHIGTATVPGSLQLELWMRNKLLFVRRHGTRADNAATVLSFFWRTVPYHVLRRVRRPREAWNVLRVGLRAVRWNVADASRLGRWRRPPSTGAGPGR